MYAVFADGSRQYRVSEGDVVKLDYRDAEVGAPLELGRVLLYAKEGEAPQIGQPLVEGARVLAEVVGHPSTKLYIQKFRKRKNYRRLKGHRQYYTQVRVRHILLAGQGPPPEQEEQPSAAAQESEQPAPQETTPETFEGAPE
jgi:large subunit ribosomal protein L21